MPEFDVVGVGLNATDSLILLPRFPAYGGKVAYEEEILSPGGQVATAIVTCARLGLRSKYIGTVGGDERGRILLDSLRETGVNIDDVQVRPGAPNQSAYILIDCTTGERTVLARRPNALRLDAAEITPEQIRCARLLHIDGHDTQAVARAAQIAREAAIPVTVDIDTVYHGFGSVLPCVDYLLASSEFPLAWTNERDPFKALERIQEEYGMYLAGMTLGAHGALVRVNRRFLYSPGFVVACTDTTGAGDVFHGAFCYAVLQKMGLPEALDFSNAMAALNCTALGARGGIATAEAAAELIRKGERRKHPEIAAGAQASSR